MDVQMARLWSRRPGSIYGNMHHKHRCTRPGDLDDRYRVIERAPGGMGMVGRGEDQERGKRGEGGRDACIGNIIARR